VAGFFALTMDITPMKRIEAQLEQLARHDSLTGLANRRYFEEKLSEFLLQREQGPFAVMFLDIDEFKAINDHYGHGTGDAALKHFSDCLRKCVRASDTVARLAGDEFVVFLPGVHTKDDAEMIARKIIGMVQSGFTVGDERLIMTTSIGIAYAKEVAMSADDLLATADEALYGAKSTGRNRFNVIECSVNEKLQGPARRRRNGRPHQDARG
jgi:diguanylate cyclase (GGDEF)-like protein